ncbi:hypothetical protein Aperf_G00000037063 [Anoplocephala perfoliata]
MPRVDRAQYEVLIDEEIPYNNEDLERMPVHALQLDSTHNLDTFFTQIYQYHQNGGFYAKNSISLSQIWGVKRFCTITLDMPTSDSELNDLTWSDVLKRLINVQTQMPLSRSNKVLNELDIYNRILRRENFLIGMLNREVFPFRFHLPPLSLPYVYLPRFYLFLLKQLLFGYKSPFETYWQLRPEYKFLGRRLELAEEFSRHSRVLGFICLLFSPVIFIVQILLFLFSNAQRLRFNPAQLAGRTWSNYARLYLRHFNELPHEMGLRLSLAHKAAAEYLDCFQSRFLSVLASHLIFMLGGLSLLLLLASAIKEGFLHLPGYLAMIALGGIVAKVCISLIPSEDVFHVPRIPLESTLAIIHYMPDKWLCNAHTSRVRAEFSQLFQYRFVAAIEEILSPFLVPYILMVSLPRKSLDIVDFLRNFTVELEGVGDICSFAQLEVARHGDPTWYPTDDLPSPTSSGDGGSDDETGGQRISAVGGKTELSIAHFYSTNPNWNLSSANRKFITDLQKQFFTDMQRTQVDAVHGLYLPTTPTMRSLCNRIDPKVAMVMSIHQETDDHPLQTKNVSHIPASMVHTSFSAVCAMNESGVKSTTPTPQTESATPTEMSPPTSHRQLSDKPSTSKASAQPQTAGGNMSLVAMAASSFSVYHPSVLYQPYISQTEDRASMVTSFGGASICGETGLDMDTSSLYMHAIHQRRLRQTQRASQTSSTNMSMGAASSLRQRSLTSDGLQDEIRYQQPSHRHLGPAARGRGLLAGVSVPASLRSVRQFEGVVEENEDETSPATPAGQQQQTTGSDSSSGNTTIAAPRIVSDGVQKWPDLPPPTC